MPGDIELAGFVWTADEWAALDAAVRQQLVNAASSLRLIDRRAPPYRGPRDGRFNR